MGVGPRPLGREVVETKNATPPLDALSCRARGKNLILEYPSSGHRHSKSNRVQTDPKSIKTKICLRSVHNFLKILGRP